ncbi:MAG: hypothetical protein ACUVWV_04705 [Thermodesulfobacteriota bacterium]
MKAVLRMNLKTMSPEESQQLLLDLCEKLKRDKLIADYHFEIETPDGPVTEKCLLSGQKVIA